MNYITVKREVIHLLKGVKIIGNSLVLLAEVERKAVALIAAGFESGEYRAVSESEDLGSSRKGLTNRRIIL
jgi:hypothetical protein